MDSPRNHGSSEEEEYSCCESGWTMYIEDAFHGNDNHYVVVDDEDDKDDDSQEKDADDGYENDDGDDTDEESDDSMASDASSGPINQFPKINNKNASGKNGSKQVFQKRQHKGKTVSNEGEKSDLKARTRTTAASRVQSRGKVSKTK